MPVFVPDRPVIVMLLPVPAVLIVLLLLLIARLMPMPELDSPFSVILAPEVPLIVFPFPPPSSMPMPFDELDFPSSDKLPVALIVEAWMNKLALELFLEPIVTSPLVLRVAALA